MTPLPTMCFENSQNLYWYDVASTYLKIGGGRFFVNVISRWELPNFQSSGEGARVFFVFYFASFLFLLLDILYCDLKPIEALTSKLFRFKSSEVRF